MNIDSPGSRGYPSLGAVKRLFPPIKITSVFVDGDFKCTPTFIILVVVTNWEEFVVKTFLPPITEAGLTISVIFEDMVPAFNLSFIVVM